MTYMKTFYMSDKEMERQTLTSNILGATENVYLFVIQLGSHPIGHNLGNKIVALSATLFTMMMFICYTTDITAEMTSGPPKVPIRNFEDVLLHGYKILTTSGYYKNLLSNAEPGTAKHIVYKKYIEKQVPMTGKDALKAVFSEPKTLLYNLDTTALHPKDPKDKYLLDQVVVLKMDASDNLMVGFGLQKDSEFLALFNHYILKGMESGILDRLFKYHHRDMFTKDQFGIPEPQPLSHGNVIFLFICLGAGISASLIVALVELIIAKRNTIGKWYFAKIQICFSSG